MFARGALTVSGIGGGQLIVRSVVELNIRDEGA
jgi:hypothetical protein